MRSGVSGVNAYFQPRKTDLYHDSAAAIAHSIVRSIFSKGVIRIAVQPMLAGLRRCDHGVTAGVRVFAGVLIGRAVAAQRDSTCLARPEMHPIRTDLYAFFAFATMRLLD
jgi:hypothetical protein